MTHRGWPSWGVLAIGLALAFVGLAWFEASSPRTPARAEQARLTIALGSSGAYEYTSPALTVPAHSVLTITIVNYDPLNHTTMARYCNVSGAMDAMMDRMGPGMMGSSGQEYRGLPMGGVSHTFTVTGPGFSVNVPVPAARSATDPSVISFTFQVGDPGSYAWQCESGEMGAMMANAGTLAVVAA